MIHGPDRRLRAAGARSEPGCAAPETRQSGSPGDRTAAAGGPRQVAPQVLARAFAAPLYALAQGLMTVATAVCFERIRVANRGRLPARGPVVLIANHPAAWTDVVVLDIAFGRKLHFLAHEALYRPRVRGLLLRLYGALPVYFRHESGGAAARNRTTFARARELLARGEAIAVFPEGVSEPDGALLPLKTGAARLILEHGAPWPAVPVAIRYEDRRAFRDRVTLAVGEPVPPGPFLARHAIDPDGAARAYTAAMAVALERALVVAAAAARGARRRSGGALGGALIAVLGAVGRVLHVPATALIEALARRYAREPQRVALGRIVLGAVLVPAWYATIGALLLAFDAGAWIGAGGLLPVLGGFACLDVDRRRAAVRGAAETRS